eukprot:6208608-Pleurochrysis_carterae.AAC.2
MLASKRVCLPVGGHCDCLLAVIERQAWHAPRSAPFSLSCACPCVPARSAPRVARDAACRRAAWRNAHVHALCGRYHHRRTHSHRAGEVIRTSRRSAAGCSCGKCTLDTRRLCGADHEKAAFQWTAD